MSICFSNKPYHTYLNLMRHMIYFSKFSTHLVYIYSEKKTVGVFWHNAAETWIDIASNTADKVLLYSICLWHMKRVN